jgi:DNA polymerase-1
MILIDEEIYQRNLPAYLVLTIHDELVFEVKKEVKEEMRGIIKERMEKVFALNVPFEVNLTEGENLSSK